ncbi:MAG: phosphoribosylamine--glycine ligase, partial [Acidimicrobiia bacterium]
AQDYKPIFDGNRGPNTGGMGSYSPVGFATPEVVDRVTEEVFNRLGEELRASKQRYVGVIYAGLMLTIEGPKIIEFNCRFGDPETQALIPRFDSDLAKVMMACVEGSLEGTKLSWSGSSCVSVVAASAGYPGNYETGKRIEGLEDAEEITGIPVFHAGTSRAPNGPDGKIVTSGGRVVAVSALGDDQPAARGRAYEALSKISFDGMTHRADIAA